MLHHYLQHGVPLSTLSAEEKLRLVTPRVKQESYYQTLTENILESGHQYLPMAGFTDVSLQNAHVEIKHRKNYHQTVGQLAKYNMMSPKPYLVVILFGKMSDPDFLIDFFRKTDVTHLLYYDEDDNLLPLYRSTPTISPYFGSVGRGRDAWPVGKRTGGPNRKT